MAAKVDLKQSRWLSAKPGPQASIQFGHPHAIGLCAAYLFNEGGNVGAGLHQVDALTGARSSPSNVGITYEQQELGLGINANGTGNIITIPLPNGLVFGNPWSVAIRAKLIATPALLAFWGLSDASNQFAVCDWWTSANGSLVVRVNNNSHGAILSSDPDITKWHSYVVTHTGAAVDPIIYVDGLVNSTTSSASLSNVVNNAWELNRSGAASGTDVSAAYVYLYNRVLTPSEVQRMHVDPYAMFTPPTTRIMSFIPTGGSSVFIPRIGSGGLGGMRLVGPGGLVGG